MTMRIVVTDSGLIWNHNNLFLKQFKNIVLVVCLEGKQVTEEYKCFVSPYQHVGMEIDEFGVESQKYKALESVASELKRELRYHDKIVFLTDGNPESLYPYYVIKDINEFNSLHLCTVSPWNFEEKRRVAAHRELLSDLSALKSICYIDSDSYLAKVDKGSNMKDVMQLVEKDYVDLMPRILNGIEELTEDSYFDMASKSYVPVGEGYEKIDLSKALEEITQIDIPLYRQLSTLGMVLKSYYPEEGEKIKEEIERPIARIDGKKICNVLRHYRLTLAEMNGLEFVSEECPSIGPCAGTCVKCDREAAYLRNRLAEIPLDKQKIPIFDLEQEV